MRNALTSVALATISSSLRAVAFSLALLSTTAFATPASAELPALVAPGARLVQPVAVHLRVERPLHRDVMRMSGPSPNTMGFVSSEIAERISGLIHDGVEIAGNDRRGRLFVHVESRSFGGLVSLRFRR